VAHTYAYEMTRCWVVSDIIGMKRLVQQSARITIFLSALGMGLYLFVGKAIFRLWVNQEISPDKFTIVFGACYAFFLSINQNQKTKFYAVNHGSFVSFIQLSSSLGLVILVNYMGLELKVAIIFFILAVFELLNFIIINLFTRNSLDKYFASTNQNFLREK
jgi:O-antigen/teichoic acid export membrane protein